jgi:hypothetical protein
MNAVKTNQNKKKISFILEDEVLGMAAEDKNVLIPTDDEIVEQLTYIELSPLFKFNGDNLPEDIAEHDDDFKDLCDKPKWKVKCFDAYCDMQKKIREKKCEIENNPKFRSNALNHYYKTVLPSAWLLRNWGLRVKWAIEDEEKFKAINYKFDGKFIRAQIKSSLKMMSKADFKRLCIPLAKLL